MVARYLVVLGYFSLWNNGPIMAEITETVTAITEMVRERMEAVPLDAIVRQRTLNSVRHFVDQIAAFTSHFHYHQMGRQSRFPPACAHWDQNASHRRYPRPRIRAHQTARAPQYENWGQHQGARAPPAPGGPQGQLAGVHLSGGDWYRGDQSYHRGRWRAIRGTARRRLRWLQKPKHLDDGWADMGIVRHHNQRKSHHQGALTRALEWHAWRPHQNLRPPTGQPPSQIKWTPSWHGCTPATC